jgi:hypothetical protein
MSRETPEYISIFSSIFEPDLLAELEAKSMLMKAKIKSEVFESINQKYPDGKVAIDSSALVIYGEK